jgi:hypothetical protein
MTTLREAAQQALEALKNLSNCHDGPHDSSGECPSCHERSYMPHAPDCEKQNAITALRAALAQQDEPKGGGNLPPPLQAEPVANASSWFALVMNAAAEIEDASHCLRDEAAKRVAISGAKHYRDAANALYTAPPRREWQSLSEEEIDRWTPEIHPVIRAVEAALKEKNA